VRDGQYPCEVAVDREPAGGRAYEHSEVLPRATARLHSRKMTRIIVYPLARACSTQVPAVMRMCAGPARKDERAGAFGSAPLCLCMAA